MGQRRRRWNPQRHLCILRLVEFEVEEKVINAPMKTVSDSAVKMHGYELFGGECRARTIIKRVEAHDEGDGHPKPLEHISQGPDCKRIGVGGFDDRKCVKSYGSHKHLDRAYY